VPSLGSFYFSLPRLIEQLLYNRKLTQRVLGNAAFSKQIVTNPEIFEKSSPTELEEDDIVQDEKLVPKILIDQRTLTQLKKYTLHFLLCRHLWR